MGLRVYFILARLDIKAEYLSQLKQKRLDISLYAYTLFERTVAKIVQNSAFDFCAILTTKNIPTVPVGLEWSIAR